MFFTGSLDGNYRGSIRAGTMSFDHNHMHRLGERSKLLCHNMFCLVSLILRSSHDPFFIPFVGEERF